MSGTLDQSESAPLHAAGISCSYGDRPVLREVGVALAAGQLTILLGPNGSGKSTLIRALLGAVPAAGRIEWFGRPLQQWRRRELARRVAYLPQSPQFEAGDTVAEVLRLGRVPYWGAFGLESARDSAVVGDVAERMGVAELLHRPMESLSGGQQQRALIGRCLAQEPAALLLDEPEAHLDLRHAVELCQLLRRLAAERAMAVLLAVHDLNLAAAFADQIVLLSGGTVAARGGVEMLTPQLLERVYGLPMVRLAGVNKSPVFLPAAFGESSAGAIS